MGSQNFKTCMYGSGWVGSVAQNIFKIFNLYVLFNRPVSSLNFECSCQYAYKNLKRILTILIKNIENFKESVYSVVVAFMTGHRTVSQYKTTGYRTPAYRRTPLQFWKEWPNEYPILVQIARRVSCIIC